MGYMVHHALIVTSFDRAQLEDARATALDLYGQAGFASLVSPLMPGIANSEATFVVVPDGSKEGWDESTTSDRARFALMEYLRQMAHDDGSSSVRWCEVQFGDERGDDRMVRCDSRPYSTTVAPS